MPLLSLFNTIKAALPPFIKRPLRGALVGIGMWPPDSRARGVSQQSGNPLSALTSAVAELAISPAQIAHKTWDPSHPKYDVHLARNYPGTFNLVPAITERTESSQNHPLYRKIMLEKSLQLASANPATYDFLRPQLDYTAKELETDANYKEFRDKLFELEEFVAELNRKGPGRFFHGGISLDDGAFLYWLVRNLKPKAIVQTDTSNGISCAFMTMALARNDEGGKLYAVDLPQVYEPENSKWNQPITYGVLIPPGKTSGWLVPEALRKSIQIWQGDAKDLLPNIVKEVGQIDFFFHDSDHTYDHMWFEFEQVLPNIRKPGLIVADNASWGPVTWEFAESIGCYSFNHRGSQGLIFL